MFAFSLTKKKAKCKKNSLYLCLHIASSYESAWNASCCLSSLLTCYFATPNSLVFDISHILCDRYRVLFTIYLRKAGGINRSRPNTSIKRQYSFLFFHSCTTLISRSLVFSLSYYILVLLKRARLNDWCCSSVQFSSSGGKTVSRVSTSGIYFSLRARARACGSSTKEKLCSSLALSLSHSSCTPNTGPSASLHYPLLHPRCIYIILAAQSPRPLCLSFSSPFPSSSRARYRRLNGKNETYKAPRQRKILSYRTEMPRINPRSQMRR